MIGSPAGAGSGKLGNTPSLSESVGMSPRSPSVLAVHRVIVRTFKGLTWRRFGIFCIFVAVLAFAYTIPHQLANGKGATQIAQHALAKFGSMMLLYVPVLLSVIAIDNWAPRHLRIGVLALGIALSVMAGLALSDAALTIFDADHFWVPKYGPRSLVTKLGWWITNYFLAALATTVYFYVVREDEAHTTLHREEMDRLGLEREMTEAHLQVMQAQIEPHFLFNTLANVRRLYQTDPPMGRAMLQHLSRYLSAALPQMRESQSTLGRELALTVAYLNVQKIRMGGRLSFDVDVPEVLKACAVPPMMLLTLVENAIRHGLVPLPKGGTVCVSARAEAGTLRLQVADTGRGMQASSGAGVGLANIRARLKTLYETDARLSLAQNPTSGVIATLELPVAVLTAEAKAA